MNYALLSLLENPPSGFRHCPVLQQKDLRRWPFALLASDCQGAEAALAPFGASLAGIVVTLGTGQSWRQLGPMLFHLGLPAASRDTLATLVSGHLDLLGQWQAAEGRCAGQALNLMRAREDGQRQRVEFATIKQSLVQELVQRKQVQGELLATRNHLAATLDAMPDLLFEVGLDGRIYDYHSPRTDLLAAPPELFLNRRMADVVPPEVAEVISSAIWEAHATGSTVGRQYELALPTGRFWFELSGTAKSVDPGQPPRIILLARDITDRKVFEREQLKVEKLESLGVLAGGIAHDFNNLLTAIMGNLSFAQLFLEPAHKSYRPLAEAEKASVRAKELSQQLLTFARGGEPVKTLVPVGHLVQETVSLLLHGSNVKASLAIPDGLHGIVADEGQLSQAFGNLILNAAQAMPGGGLLRVTAANEYLGGQNAWSLAPGSYLRLDFADQGCGIPGEDLGRIFDPYFTTKLTGKGLGLASVHSIICRHGGHIGADSVPGQGTTFTIYLPSTGESYRPEWGAQAARPEQGGAAGTILVMDDEQIIRDMAYNMLEFLGYRAECCEGGAEAIERYRAARASGAPYRAVIMDLTIPGGVGGREAARQILEFDPRACLIVSSGYSNDPVLADYGSYGFSGAVAKPYQMEELDRQLRAILAGR
jgi:two-component system, cell cycle sensor histidine kinase and response regulator CckA